MGWIFSFIALGYLKGECVLGELCFSQRTREATFYGLIVAAGIALIVVVAFLRGKRV
jgi:hypothetical protein